MHRERHRLEPIGEGLAGRSVVGRVTVEHEQVLDLAAIKRRKEIAQSFRMRQTLGRLDPIDGRSGLPVGVVDGLSRGGAQGAAGEEQGPLPRRLQIGQHGLHEMPRLAGKIRRRRIAAAEASGDLHRDRLDAGGRQRQPVVGIGPCQRPNGFDRMKRRPSTTCIGPGPSGSASSETITFALSRRGTRRAPSAAPPAGS